MPRDRALAEDLADLRWFNEKCQQMLGRRLARDPSFVRLGTFTLEGSVGSGFKARTPAPDEEDYRSFLLDFRFFVAKREPTHLGKILGLLEQRLTSDQLRDANRSNQQQWRQSLRGSVMELHINEARYRAEDYLDAFINGVYFHSADARQRALLDGALAEGGAGRFFAERIVANLVLEVTELVICTRNVAVRAMTDHALR